MEYMDNRGMKENQQIIHTKFTILSQFLDDCGAEKRYDLIRKQK